jgi:MFS family permease
VAVMCMFQFGVVISAIGALKLSAAKDQNLDNRQVAGMILALMLISAVVVLLVGPLVQAFGHRPLAVVGLVTGALGLSLLVLARNYAFAVLACIILGVGGICACTVSSTLMPLVLFGGKNAPAASNLVNAFFGLGALFTALIVGIAQKGRHYRTTGHFLALVMLLVAVSALAADYPSVQTGFGLSRAIALLGNSIIDEALRSGTCFCTRVCPGTPGRHPVDQRLVSRHALSIRLTGIPSAAIAFQQSIHQGGC